MAWKRGPISARKRGSDTISVQLVGEIGTPVARCCDGERSCGKLGRLAGCCHPGLVVDAVTVGSDEVNIAAHALGRCAVCPGCGRLSRRIHSRYDRCLSDVPAHGRRVRVRLSVRRFRCPHSGCPRKIFAERLESGITRPYARRTTRLQQLVRCPRAARRPEQVADRWHLLERDADRGRRCGRASSEACQPGVPRRRQEVPRRHS